MNDPSTISLARIPSLSLEAVAGIWYIHYSNCAMWLKGDKQEPSVQYHLVEGDEGPELENQTFYQQGIRQKSMRGRNRPLNPECTRLEWKGRGWLLWACADWEWVYMDDDFVLIFYERSLFSAGGYDLMTRDALLRPEQHEQIIRFLDESGIWGMQRIR